MFTTLMVHLKSLKPLLTHSRLWLRNALISEHAHAALSYGRLRSRDKIQLSPNTRQARITNPYG